MNIQQERIQALSNELDKMHAYVRMLERDNEYMNECLQEASDNHDRLIERCNGLESMLTDPDKLNRYCNYFEHMLMQGAQSPSPDHYSAVGHIARFWDAKPDNAPTGDIPFCTTIAH